MSRFSDLIRRTTGKSIGENVGGFIGGKIAGSSGVAVGSAIGGGFTEIIDPSIIQFRDKVRVLNKQHKQTHKKPWIVVHKQDLH